MKVLFFCIYPLLLLASSPFESEKNHHFNWSAFNSANNKATAKETDTTRCRLICDKKITKEKTLQDALNFYKNSKIYRFKN